jgi:hypothetical protein
MGEVLSGPLSERRDASAARVRPAPRPCLPPRGFERMGVAFSLVTFFWRPKESHPPAGRDRLSNHCPRSGPPQSNRDTTRNITCAMARDARPPGGTGSGIIVRAVDLLA